MDNYDTSFLNTKNCQSIAPYDNNITSILPNIFDKFIKNDITNLNSRNKVKREIHSINKYFNKNKKILYTIIYKTYQNQKLVDIFFLLNKKHDTYVFIENIKNVYDLDKEIVKDLSDYKTIYFNDIIVKILIINNLEYDLENNNFGWASLYEIINSNKLNGLYIEKKFINFLSNNLMEIKYNNS
jgi:hypothetical protein